MLNIFTKKSSSELKPMGVRTVNAHFANIPKDESYVKEMAQIRKQYEGVLSSTDIIKDTFKLQEI
jgi:hypothetical protein